MILCLYNSYDKLRLHDIHIRSVARAAPVCCALGFHLALLDFPEPMYDRVMASTTIGKSGYLLQQLKERSQFTELTKTLPLATLVITTSQPQPQKRVTCQQLVHMSSRGEVLAFIIGLGRRGLPRPLKKKALYHWDVTDRGISLETCTAIGYIAARFHTAMELAL
ncbi:MAG: DUF531 family protein [Theionarchaea archaeon]|nr:DUF531 family protein [Theionarchaea archaeon]MBU7001735.1 DUF531 family protein [Theionarchaea archaeon]MBU7020963.1 DUF531 family protein [Theionarchaea archaeon]MBU7034399.1 DUF531 family protein [Theionarchaea archaeon]MBU7040038.1 DUF531 family protein [Theionarchaea archaeon]